MVGPTGQLWWLALRASYNGWPSCFDGGSHRAVVMVGLACPLQWIAQLVMMGPPLCWYGGLKLIKWLCWCGWPIGLNVGGLTCPLGQLTLHAPCDGGYWPQIMVIICGPARWWWFICHVWWLACMVLYDDWPVGPIVIGPTCPLQWLTAGPLWQLALMTHQLCLT